jgi:guanosine-3',5'-bis(diphosphate) 3'-pyrophosphohydrolase
MTENPMVTLARAYHFAAARNVDQRRKGEAAEPYMNHLAEVADLVAQATRATDPEIIIAAVLHDTVEDTKTSVEELTALFGERVAKLVSEVTDDKALPTQTRKDLQVAHAANASRGARSSSWLTRPRTFARWPPARRWVGAMSAAWTTWPGRAKWSTPAARPILGSPDSSTSPRRRCRAQTRWGQANGHPRSLRGGEIPGALGRRGSVPF